MPTTANDNHPLSRQHSAVQPRGLRRVAAASYLGISPSHFDKQRDAGAIPAPRLLFGVMLYDRHDLDRIFDGVSAANDNDSDYWERRAAEKT